MHLVDSGWMPIHEAKHEVLAVTARTPIEPRAPGSLRASRVAGANGASRRRAPGPAGSASSSIAVVTASGGAATGPTSGGVTVS
ncbi:glutaconyl-CoA decarboxylase subunit gamma domain protein [Actinomyces sp. oral taxon 170 str. F0386]|nr:glutaconyl-CoA decarboxylase subunit gamma domain protein [Actinomyces sp. oral taxon 170 str. F0386]